MLQPVEQAKKVKKKHCILKKAHCRDTMATQGKKRRKELWCMWRKYHHHWEKKKGKLHCNFNSLLWLFIIIPGYTSVYFTSAFNVNKCTFTIGWDPKWARRKHTDFSVKLNCHTLMPVGNFFVSFLSLAFWTCRMLLSWASFFLMREMSV